VTGCHCVRIRDGRAWPVRDCWDPVSGRCGRCGQRYRVAIVVEPLEEGRPVSERDLRPTAMEGE
jgi:hypothetical protein